MLHTWGSTLRFCNQGKKQGAKKQGSHDEPHHRQGIQRPLPCRQKPGEQAVADSAETIRRGIYDLTVDRGAVMVHPKEGVEYRELHVLTVIPAPFPSRRVRRTSSRVLSSGLRLNMPSDNNKNPL